MEIEQDEWWKRARCLGAPTKYFYRPDGVAEHEFDEVPGKAMCALCPVFKDCFWDRMEGMELGMWAHIAEHERRIFTGRVVEQIRDLSQEELRSFVMNKTIANRNRRKRGDKDRRGKREHGPDAQRVGAEAGDDPGRGEQGPEGPGEGCRGPSAVEGVSAA